MTGYGLRAHLLSHTVEHYPVQVSCSFDKWNMENEEENEEENEATKNQEAEWSSDKTDVLFLAMCIVVNMTRMCSILICLMKRAARMIHRFHPQFHDETCSKIMFFS